jgi:hypothetical protein
MRCFSSLCWWNGKKEVLATKRKIGKLMSKENEFSMLIAIIPLVVA